MKSRVMRFVGAAAVSLAIVVAAVGSASAAPLTGASCVAKCATAMGGQHIAQCAKTMQNGVSTCARQ